MKAAGPVPDPPVIPATTATATVLDPVPTLVPAVSAAALVPAVAAVDPDPAPVPAANTAASVPASAVDVQNQLRSLLALWLLTQHQSLQILCQSLLLLRLQIQSSTVTFTVFLQLWFLWSLQI